MREFWDKDGLYSFLRYYVDFTTRRSYRRLTVLGQLPPEDDGVATIYAANHTNTLMDALVVLQLRHGGTLFGARADVFRKPAIARILHFLKMLPLARHNRDKAEEVAHNRIAFEEIDRALAHGLPFCLFPEGRHRPMHSLLPMRRGIATLAFKSAAQRPTRIVPIGIDYSDWFHYRGDAVVRIGEPLDVNAFAAGIPANTQDSDRDALLQDEMYKRLSSLIFFILDDEHNEESNACNEKQPGKQSGIFRRDRDVQNRLFAGFCFSALNGHNSAHGISAAQDRTQDQRFPGSAKRDFFFAEYRFDRCDKIPGQLFIQRGFQLVFGKSRPQTIFRVRFEKSVENHRSSLKMINVFR